MMSRCVHGSLQPISRNQRTTKNHLIKDKENGGTLPDAARPATELPAQDKALKAKNRSATQYGIGRPATFAFVLLFSSVLGDIFSVIKAQ